MLMPQLSPVDLPQTVQVGEYALELRLMTAEDSGRLLTFARGLPSIDLLFLRRSPTGSTISSRGATAPCSRWQATRWWATRR